MDQQRLLILRRSMAASAMALLAAVSLQALADAPDKGLTRQIKLIEQEMARVIPDDRQPDVRARLARSAAAAGAERLYLALYELESAFETTRAFAFAQESAAVKSQADFAARWKSVGAPRPSATKRALPAVVEALAASAESRAPSTYLASLPYASDAGVGAGLYYLGESRAFVEYAAFARALDWPAPASASRVRSIGAELESLEAEVTNAYERMTPSQHPAYVLASVTLKRARALNDAGHHAGALLEYLLARYRFATLRPGPLAEPPAPARVADARARLDAGTDHSIATLFLDMADVALASDNVNARRAAALILDDVLPAYHAALDAQGTRTQGTPGTPGTQGTQGTPGTPGPPGTPGTPVTITLVRWPFT